MFLTVCSWCVSWRWAVGVGASSVVGAGVASRLGIILTDHADRLAAWTKRRANRWA